MRSIVSAATVVLMLFVTAIPARAQSGTVTPSGDIYGRPGWVLENGTIRVSLLRGGGHIAELRLVSTNPRLALNPAVHSIPSTGLGAGGKRLHGAPCLLSALRACVRR